MPGIPQFLSLSMLFRPFLIITVVSVLSGCSDAENWEVAVNQGHYPDSSGEVTVRKLAVSPNGKHYATISKDDGVVKIWRTKDRTLVRTLSANRVGWIFFIDDKRLLTVSMHGMVSSLNIMNGERTIHLESSEDYLDGFSINRQSRKFIMFKKKFTEIYQFPGFKKIKSIDNKDFSVPGITLMHNESAYIYIDNKSRLIKYNLKSNKTSILTDKKATQTHPPQYEINYLSYMEISPDDQTLVMRSRRSTSTVIYRLDTNIFYKIDNYQVWPWISPDNQHLIFSAQPGKLVFYNIKTRKETRLVDIKSVSDIHDLKILADKKNILLAGSTSKGKGFSHGVYNLEQKKLYSKKYKINLQATGAVAFVDGGRYIISAHKGGKLLKWDAKTGMKVSTVETHLKDIYSLTVADKRGVLTGAGSGQKVFVFDIKKNKISHLYKMDDGAKTVGLSPGGNVLAIGSAYDCIRQVNLVNHVWFVKSGVRRADGTWTADTVAEQRMPLGHGQSMTPDCTVWGNSGSRVSRIRFDANEKYLVFASGRRKIKVRNLKGEYISVHEIPETIIDFDIDPQSKHIVVIAKEGNVLLSDIKTGKILYRVKLKNKPLVQVKFSKSGKIVYTLSQAGELVKLDTVSGKKIGSVQAATSQAIGMDVGPEDKMLAIAQRNNSISLFDLKKNRSIALLRLLPKNQWVSHRIDRAEYIGSKNAARHIVIRKRDNTFINKPVSEFSKQSNVKSVIR